jgi:succinoglycan biosynthesis protein ExoM
MLRRLLEKLSEQQTGDAFTFSVVVADNDAAESARSTVENYSAEFPLDIVYCVEPQRNIAMVRNRAFSRARGKFIALIDDDEFPVENWLWHLLETCEAHSSAGVLGPVRPHFAQEPPRWLIQGGFCERPEYPTGTRLSWRESRTGNALIRRAIVEDLTEPFSPQFESGGEDQDFFRRMMEREHEFCWCNEAVTYETVPPNRWNRSFMLKRALLRGRNSLKHRKGRLAILGKSILAVPLYIVSLPMAVIVGHHEFMRCMVKLCDHFGRVLTVLRLNPVNEREM